MTLDYQSATEKFSVLSGEFYNLPAQLPDFSSFLGTWWHCFGLLCHCPLSFLSSPFPVLATLHRDLYKMTENHLLHSFSTSSSCQLFSSDWSWCPEEVWIIYHNRRGVKHSYCPSISLQDEKHGDCWWQSKSSPSPGLLLLQLPSPQLWGSGEGKSFPFLSSVLFSRLRLGESCWFGELVLNGLHTAGWDFGCFSGRGWTSASCPGCPSANRGLGGKGLDTVRLVPVFALLIQFQCRKSPTH